MSLSVNVNTQSSHGGSFIGGYVSDASTNVKFGGAFADKLGTVYNCPNPAHSGNHAVANGSGSVNINGLPAANQDSALDCGAKLDVNNFTSVVIGG